MLLHRIHINHQKLSLCRHFAPGRRCTQNYFDDWTRISQIIFLFLILGFWERIVSNRPKTYTRPLVFWQLIALYKIWIWSILFQRLNLNIWPAAHCTLPTAQFTLHTAPAPANVPESEHVHFILPIEHCTMHTTCLYCILQMYHLQTSKICLSWSQDLHGKMYLDIILLHSPSRLTIYTSCSGLGPISELQLCLQCDKYVCPIPT